MANKTFDLLGLITEGEVVTTTASCTGAEIVGLNLGSASYVVVVNTSDLVGTFDADHNYALSLEVCDTLGGTYETIGAVEFLAAEQAQIGFTSEQIERSVTGAKFFRITATKVGTNATGITYTAFVSKV